MVTETEGPHREHVHVALGEQAPSVRLERERLPMPDYSEHPWVKAAEAQMRDEEEE